MVNKHDVRARQVGEKHDQDSTTQRRAVAGGGQQTSAGVCVFTHRQPPHRFRSGEPSAGAAAGRRGSRRLEVGFFLPMSTGRAARRGAGQHAESHEEQ